MIVIDEGGDLTVEVAEQHRRLYDHAGAELTKQITLFEVRKDTLVKAS